MSLKELLQAEKETEKRLRKNKAANKARKKARRKLLHALKAGSLQEMRILVGMSLVALDKAQFHASVLSTAKP